jgi:hypothetical protein
VCFVLLSQKLFIAAETLSLLHLGRPYRSSFLILEPGYLIRYSDCLPYGRPGLYSRHRQNFILTLMSRLAVGPTQFPVQQETEALFERQNLRIVKLTAHLNLVPWSKMAEQHSVVESVEHL